MILIRIFYIHAWEDIITTCKNEFVGRCSIWDAVINGPPVSAPFSALAAACQTPVYSDVQSHKVQEALADVSVSSAPAAARQIPVHGDVQSHTVQEALDDDVNKAGYLVSTVSITIAPPPGVVSQDTASLHSEEFVTRQIEVDMNEH